MELGIGMFGDLAFDQSTGKYRDAGTKLHEILEQVKLMDEVGIDVSLWENITVRIMLFLPRKWY
ncbi:hypothetical protein QWZ06_22810 [Chryseobacterium tructae]|uniref:hypothetical protein n=1 Tax=Chryseobacterium tructae TaxID=1037380 RepID=UPI0025B310B1|nr:hypothetical protein [Chryseobacterium tructae]MDN3694882.1 hypothetical protein [Chryseobacterium tructae]